MMYYVQQPSHAQQFVAPETIHGASYSTRIPMAPAAVGAAPGISASGAVGGYQGYYNPTMVQHNASQSSSMGYYPQPQSIATPQPTVVKRHNPYAPVNTSSSTATTTTAMPPQAPSFHEESYATNPHHANLSSVTSMEFNYSSDMSMDGAMMMVGNNQGQGKFSASTQHVVSTEELMMHRGNLVELSRTAPGSSFIQAALREGTVYTQQNVAVIAAELLPAASVMLLDAHGCYVVKTLMERLAPDQLQRFVRAVTSDSQLVYSMCTHSLHTRRVVQYLMDSVDVVPVAEVLVQRCVEVSMTQQGCIIMQRAMDVTPEPLKAQLFSTIFDHLLEFSVDPFANYVVQHMLEIGDKELCSSAVLHAFRGNIVRLACNKFASNVLEKSLFHINPDAQHDLLHDLYEADEEVLLSMLQDSFGNYLIQSSIALASFKDVLYINDRLRSVLQRTPYGHKIELRIERRLKGRPVGTRSSQIGANSKTSRQQGRNSRDAAEPSEESW